MNKDKSKKKSFFKARAIAGKIIKDNRANIIINDKPEFEDRSRFFNKNYEIERRVLFFT